MCLSIITRLFTGSYVAFMPDEGSKNQHLGMIGRRMSQPHQPIDPFPELGTSSEEDTGTRSAASSFSSTRSNSSSRSSLTRSDTSSLKNAILYGTGASLEPESYVECQQVAMRGSPSPHHPSSTSGAKLNKPARVASFISEEPPPQSLPKAKPENVREVGKNADNGGTYVEMTPSASVKSATSATKASSSPSQSRKSLPGAPFQTSKAQSLLEPFKQPFKSKKGQKSKPAAQPLTSHQLPLSSSPQLRHAPSKPQQALFAKPASSKPQPLPFSPLPLPSTPVQQPLKPKHTPSKPLKVSLQSQSPKPHNRSPHNPSPHPHKSALHQPHSPMFELPKPPPCTLALPLPESTSTLDVMAQFGDDPYYMMEPTATEPLIAQSAEQRQSNPVTEKFDCSPLVVDLGSDSTPVASSASDGMPRALSTGSGGSGDGAQLETDRLAQDYKVGARALSFVCTV